MFFFSFLLSFPSLEAIERQSSRQVEKQISTLLANKSGVGIGFHKLCPRTRLIYHPHGNQKNQSEAFSTNMGNGTFSFQITEFVPVLYYRPLSTDSWCVSGEVISPASCGWTTSCLSMIPCLWWLHILSFLIWVQAPLKISRYSLTFSFLSFSFYLLRSGPRKAQKHPLFVANWKLPSYPKVYVVLFIPCY